MNGIQLDFNSILLCGRNKELGDLSAALESISVETRTKILLIEEPSGSGKSALIKSFREYVRAKKQFFFLGKHEESINDPFGALSEALNDMLSQVLEDELNLDLSTLVKAELATREISILACICPRILTLLDEEELASASTLSISSNRSLQQLRVAVRSFFRLICKQGKVVLVLLRYSKSAPPKNWWECNASDSISAPIV
jgi:predicted ATPase